MQARSWMIYGATGYTGELIAREAKKRGLSPTLAGRNAEKTRLLAERLALPHLAFGLDDDQLLNKHLAAVDLVVHCAGPFSATSAPMVEACIQTGTHYLDITGEIDVFEAVAAQHARAAQGGIVLLPGAGFDVIPTDCLAAALHRAMPDATHLCLGFQSGSSLSPGTAKTSVEGMAKGCKVRRDGIIVPIPFGARCRNIDFGQGTRHAAAIPWGDISTAFHSTGIPNIEVYLPYSPKAVRRLKFVNLLRPALKLSLVQNILKNRIDKNVRGPSEAKRSQLATLVWGEVRNAAGDCKSGRIKTANGYDVTVSGALALVDYLTRETPQGGFYTPSKLMGPNFVETLPGSGKIAISDEPAA